MNDYQDQIERQTRNAIGAIATCCGLIFLSGSLLVLLDHAADEKLALPQLIFGSITGIAAIAQLPRRHFVVGAIVQALLGLVMGMFTLVCASGSALEPHDCAALIGSLLIAFGAFGRVNAELGERSEFQPAGAAR